MSITPNYQISYGKFNPCALDRRFDDDDSGPDCRRGFIDIIERRPQVRVRIWQRDIRVIWEGTTTQSGTRLIDQHVEKNLGCGIAAYETENRIPSYGGETRRLLQLERLPDTGVANSINWDIELPAQRNINLVSRSFNGIVAVFCSQEVELEGPSGPYDSMEYGITLVDFSSGSVIAPWKRIVGTFSSGSEGGAEGGLPGALLHMIPYSEEKILVYDGEKLFTLTACDNYFVTNDCDGDDVSGSSNLQTVLATSGDSLARMFHSGAQYAGGFEQDVGAGTIKHVILTASGPVSSGYTKVYERDESNVGRAHTAISSHCGKVYLYNRLMLTEPPEGTDLADWQQGAKTLFRYDPETGTTDEISVFGHIASGYPLQTSPLSYYTPIISAGYIVKDTFPGGDDPNEPCPAGSCGDGDGGGEPPCCADGGGLTMLWLGTEAGDCETGGCVDPAEAWTCARYDIGVELSPTCPGDCISSFTARVGCWTAAWGCFDVECGATPVHAGICKTEVLQKTCTYAAYGVTVWWHYDFCTCIEFVVSTAAGCRDRMVLKLGNCSY